MKKKFKLKKQLVFNCISILFVMIFTIYYGYRFFHYKNEKPKPIVYSNILAERVIQDEEDSLLLTNGIYRYVGKVENNYVKYMGYRWQIMRINEDKSITMILESPITYLAYGDTNKFSNSQIYSWLTKVDDMEYTGIFQDSLDESFLVNTITCTDKFSKIEDIGCFERETDYKISLLGVRDYYDAGGKNSYLNNGTYFWTTNGAKTGEFWYISDDGKLGTDYHSSRYGIRPVITLKPGVKIISGIGSFDLPYVINERTIETTADAYIGEYLYYNDILWRVIGKDETSIKITTEECLKDKNDSCIEMIFSKDSNKFDMKSRDALLTYLNTEYYKSIQNNEFIVEGTYYNGFYSRLNDYDYLTSFFSPRKAFVGLLSMAEPFVYDTPNIFLLTTNSVNDITIYVINEDRLLFEDMVNNEYYVRPSIYLRNDIKILDGDGNYLSPYILGGIVDEN